MTHTEFKKLSCDVAEISTGGKNGRYYDEISHWYCLLDNVVQNANCTMSVYEYPKVYNAEGRGLLEFVDDEYKVYQILWTYFRMSSGRWEIICYVT
jgi:hypothetical protein